jgi:hypothetical protein
MQTGETILEKIRGELQLGLLEFPFSKDHITLVVVLLPPNYGTNMTYSCFKY